MMNGGVNLRFCPSASSCIEKMITKESQENRARADAIVFDTSEKTELAEHAVLPELMRLD
jgi:hypothetical protein